MTRTRSRLGEQLLGDWDAALPRFWQLVPPSEANTPEASQVCPCIWPLSTLPVFSCMPLW